MLKQLLVVDYNKDSVVLAKPTRIVFQKVFHGDRFKFDTSFPSQCQEDSVISTLKTLVSMPMYGADLKQQETKDSKVCLSVYQTILLNT